MSFGRRLRVAYVYRNFNHTGSIPTLYVRNAERLSYDEDVTVFCSGTTRDAPASGLLRFETVEPIVKGRDRLRYAIECATFAARATRALTRLRDRFDVVHVEGFAAREADLVTVHAVRPAEIRHYFEHVEPGANPIRRRLAPNLLRPQSGAVMRIERALFQNGGPPYCLSPSRRVKADLERWYGVPSELVEVLPYGIETGTFRFRPSFRARVRAELGVPEDRLVLLFVGDDFQRKGLDRALKGLARSDADAELWAIGGRDLAPYRARAAELGISNRVRLLGRQPYAELPAFYSACDILVLPTLQDSWALPVIEGMAAGRAVVTSEYAGSHEAMQHGVDGYVLEGSGSPEEIAALLAGPLGDPGTRAAVGARAARTAAAFDYERFYPRLRAALRRAHALRVSRAPAASRRRSRAADAEPLRVRTGVRVDG